MEFSPEGDRDQLYEDSNLGWGIRQSMELDVEETCFFLIPEFWAKRKLGHTDTGWEQEEPSNLYSEGARAAREEREDLVFRFTLASELQPQETSSDPLDRVEKHFLLGNSGKSQI